MLKNKTSTFKGQIDYWILESVRSGVNNFEDLLLSLPGVYPSLVLESVQRLETKGLLQPSILKRTKIDSKYENSLPFRNMTQNHIPHPLDYDWRFSSSTVTKILAYCYSLSKTNDVMILLGTPSLLENELCNFDKRSVVLLDKNAKEYRKIKKNLHNIKCNLLKDSLPKMKADLVVADPPWYLEHMYAFLWNSAQITKIGGHLLFCLPPVGTRPGIETEIHRIFEFAKSLGLTLMEYKKGVLLYETPLFEINALKANGIDEVPKRWRRGDFAIFAHEFNKIVPRPLAFEQEWIEIKIKNTRIKIRSPTSTEFDDPSLIHIIENDVLPTVSRSDYRRKMVDVWTSGNRVFACNGRNILILILLAHRYDLSPTQIVSKVLKRKLKPEENQMILSTSDQITRIIAIEQNEFKEHFNLLPVWLE